MVVVADMAVGTAGVVFMVAGEDSTAADFTGAVSMAAAFMVAVDSTTEAASMAVEAWADIAAAAWADIAGEAWVDIAAAQSPAAATSRASEARPEAAFPHAILPAVRHSTAAGSSGEWERSAALAAMAPIHS